MIEQHGEEHADGLIGIVESFEDSAAGNAGGTLADIKFHTKPQEAVKTCLHICILFAICTGCNYHTKNT